MLALLVNALLAFSATGRRAKFDAMVASVTLSPRAIEFIDSEKQRLLFKGVLAASEQPMVVDAFAIVYEDLGPVRVAGDLIAKQLSKVATSANERAAASGDVAALSALAASRNLFRLIDSDASGSLDRDELLRSPVLLDRIRAEGESDQAAVERFMSSADTDDDGQVSFVEFASAAASEPRLQMADLALDAALRAASESQGVAIGGGSGGGKRSMFGRKAPGERFDDMLAECAVWEAQLDCTPDACDLPGDDDGGGGGDGDDRMLLVLKGAFAGSRCAQISDALRVCYLEYSPLRLGGDLIFKLLKRIVASQIASQRP